MVWTECMDEWMPTISALLQPTSEVKAIVSRLSGLGKLPSYIDFIKQKKWEKQEPQLHAWILYWTTSGDLPPSSVAAPRAGAGCLCRTESMLLHFLGHRSLPEIPPQISLVKNKTEAARLRSACNTSKENNTHSPQVQLPSSRNLYKEFYRLCFFNSKVFSWECIPKFSREC